MRPAEAESSDYKVLIDSLIYFIMHIRSLAAEARFTVEAQSSSMQRGMCVYPKQIYCYMGVKHVVEQISALELHLSLCVI